MIVDTQTRNRPSLEVRTDYGGELADGLPRPGFQTYRGAMPSLSPLTAKPLPSPLQSSTPVYGLGMTHHERAMLGSLDGRGRQCSVDDGRMAVSPLSAGTEQAMASRVGKMAVKSPLHTTPPALSYTAAGASDVRRRSPQASSSRSMADETRSMLLSGMTASQAEDVRTVANRRLSAATEASQGSRRQSLTVLPPETLQAWGHVYLNDPSKADVFVAPSALRRHSGTGLADESHGKCLAIRARIRPKSKERKAFIIARNFDLEQLQTTLPTTPTTPGSSRRQSRASPSPDDLSGPARTPTALTPGLAPGRRRSSAAPAGIRTGSHQSKSSAKEMPVHLAYARSYLPVLAALMLSGHVKTGDSIDLPMPHPEAWPQTLAYVYTGGGDVTEAVRQNVLHLGGRV